MADSNKGLGDNPGAIAGIAIGAIIAAVIITLGIVWMKRRGAAEGRNSGSREPKTPKDVSTTNPATALEIEM